MTSHKIGEINDFPENRGTKVTVNGIEIAVFNIGGELAGIQNRCVHKNLPLHIIGEERFYSSELIEDGFYDLAEEERNEDQDIRGGFDEEKFTIYCPWHYLEWDLESGCNEQTGKCIATYDVEVKNREEVWIEV